MCSASDCIQSIVVTYYKNICRCFNKNRFYFFFETVQFDYTGYYQFFVWWNINALVYQRLQHGVQVRRGRNVHLNSIFRCNKYSFCCRYNIFHKHDNEFFSPTSWKYILKNYKLHFAYSFYITVLEIAIIYNDLHSQLCKELFVNFTWSFMWKSR